MKQLIGTAIEMGFTTAMAIAASIVTPEERIRNLCTPEKCSAYGTNWVCPPGGGSLESCREIISEYNNGILLQMKFTDVDTSSMETVEALSKEFTGKVIALRDFVLQKYPNAMALATGGCRECEKCTYPDNPCRKPNIRRGSLSAFGIDVGKLCEKCGVEFAFTEETLYFTACMLVE